MQLREQEITKIPVIHLRHCERSAAIHGCALRAMDRHGLRPRDDEGILVISTSLISNKALRDFATIHPDADAPLQAFRSKVEKGHFANFAALRATFMGVDKVGERFVFNIGGNKYRLIASIAFSVQRLWIKAVLTHAEYDKGDWK